MIAEMYSSCGRYVLAVAGIVVAMEGDPCRHNLPEGIAAPIPKEELEVASIEGTPAKEIPLEIVRFFRGESWSKESLEWAADQINQPLEVTD